MADMRELLKRENVTVKQRVEDWIEAVHHSVQPLVDQGYCQEEYMDHIIKETRYRGPEYISNDNLAFVHGSTKAGVIEPQMAVTVLEEPVEVKKDGVKVRVLVAMASDNEESHRKVLRGVAQIFGQEENLNKVLETQSVDKIYEMLMENL